MARKKKKTLTHSEIVKSIYRKDDIDLIQSKINMLGDTKLTVSSFMLTQLIITISVFVISLIITKHSYITAPVLSACTFYTYYYILLTSPINKRIKKLDHEALNFFEILTLTLEAGKNLENALEVTTENIDSELSDEFRKTLIEIKFGKSLVEALEDMKKRIPSENINNIILNMTQTTIFGSNILETMNNQIDFLRDKQLLEIKEHMNKLPNQVSIVSVLFIVPLILLLVLGPFLINFLS